MGRDNVIDITDRVSQPDYKARLRHLKVRLDLEQAKIAISTSLLSIVLLVTLANNNLLASSVRATAVAGGQQRGIASLSSSQPNNVEAAAATEDQHLVMEISKRALSASASMGHKPSSIEKLAFGFLEGKYAVRLQNGKLSEIEYSDAVAHGGSPKAIDDFSAFLDSHRELMPVAFDKSLKVGAEKHGDESTETYELVNRFSMPLAKVQFKVDSAGRLLVMRVAAVQVASK